MKHTTCFFNLSILILFLLPNITAQNCKDFNLIYSQANQAETDEIYCSYIKQLELTLNDCLNQKDSFDISLGEPLHQLGAICFNCSFITQTSFLQKSIEYTIQSLKIKTKHPDNFTQESIGRSYYNLGSYLIHKRKHASAIKPLENAITYLENSPIPLKSLTLEEVYLQLGDAYLAMEDYYHAFFYAQKAGNKKISTNGKILSLTTQSYCYRNLGDFKNAITKLKDIKDIIEQTNTEAWRYAYVYYDYSLVYMEMDNISASKETINQSIEIYTSANNPDTTNLLLAYHHKSQLLLHTKKIEEARQLANETMQLAKGYYPSFYHPIIAKLNAQLGEINFSEKKYNQAFENYQNAIKILMPSFNPQLLKENPLIKKEIIGEKKLLRTILNLKAKAYQQKYKEQKKKVDLEIAFDTYLKLDTLITLTRQSFKAVGSKYYLQKKIIPIYEEAINVSLQLFRLTNNSIYQEAAYNFMARNKAIILIEGLQDEKVKFSTIPEELLEKENNLKKSVYELEIEIYQLEQNGKFQETKKLKEKLFETKRTYEKLVQSFEENYPAYYQAKYDYYSDANIAEIQSKLEDDRAVIEFFVGEKKLFVSIFSTETFEIISAELPDNFKVLCEEFIEITRGESLDKNLESRFSKVSYELYKILLENALETLDHSVNRLTIIPDNIILHMPMDALLTTPFMIEKWYDDQIPYLLKKYSTSQVYANSLLFESENQKRIEKAQKSFLGFGIKYFDFTKQQPVNQLDSIVQKRMANGVLEYADDEVKEIKEIIGGDIMIDRDATKVFFLENASNYKIIHFASHAFGDENNPLSSSLIFAKTKKEMDYQLRVADIYTMDLNNTDLVVLSACQTNYGAIQEGEGMRTLSRAFAYAGSPSLIASSGNIPDKSSKDIIVDFYKNSINDGHPKDVALQLAKLNYLKNADGNTALPHLWSHLNVIGEVKKISLTSSSYSKWLVYGIVFFLGLFLITKITRRKS